MIFGALVLGQGKGSVAMSDYNLIWIDLEMTGLDPARDHILEIATVVTDSNLNILAEGPVFAIHQSNDVLENMNAWCVEQHGHSGLTDRVKQSRVTLAEAEQQTISFLQKYVSAGVSPMCGNSICQDRRFLVKGMPALEKYFHYRHLDVSTLKILAQHWKPEIMAGFVKESSHLALDDIKDSIAELQYYRKHFLKV